MKSEETPLEKVFLKSIIIRVFYLCLIINCGIVHISKSQEKEKTIYVNWVESKPFIFKDDNGVLRGIEYDILNSFKNFYQTKYKLKLNIIFREESSFSHLFDTVANSTNQSILGISAFSITDERRKKVEFSEAYMNDLSILISNANIQVAEDEQSFKKLFSDKTAITIKRTTYEHDLQALSKNNHIPFKIVYIPSNKNIQDEIAKNSNSFGFVDLFVYLMLYKENPEVTVNRQYLYVSKKLGHAIILPKQSSWKNEIDVFIKHIIQTNEINKIIRKYLDINIYKFLNSNIKGVSSFENSILFQEKEIQSSNLKWKDRLLDFERRNNVILIFSLSLVIILSIVIYLIYRKSKANNLQLKLQSQRIQLQQINIQHQNLLLEKKNERLLFYNEEKNKLMKILGHDLRTPLSQIQGLINLLGFKNNSLNDEQTEMLDMIKLSVERMNKMMTNLLNTEAIEKGTPIFDFENVEVISTVELAIRNFNTISAKKDITIKSFALVNPVYINIDFIVLFEILENLISNAIKFSNPKSTVDVDCKVLENEVIIEIKDKGVGMTEDDLTHLFQQYKKLSSKPTAGESSVGLGLYIAQNLTQQMNGRLWCESQQGIGSTFFLVFPIVNK